MFWQGAPGHNQAMKYLALILLASTPAWAEPVGFSPTLPFGIPARTTVNPVNTGGPPQSFRYNPYGYYYYYGGGAYGYSQGASTPNGGVPGYNKPLPQRDLPGYQSSPKKARPSDQLPGYNRP
jgi:hypothetical protein